MAKSRSEKKQQGRDAREAARKAQQRERFISRATWIGLPILAVVGLIAFGIIRQNNQPPLDPLANLNPANVQGDLNNSVVIIEFGDFG